MLEVRVLLLVGVVHGHEASQERWVQACLAPIDQPELIDADHWQWFFLRKRFLWVWKVQESAGITFSFCLRLLLLEVFGAGVWLGAQHSFLLLVVLPLSVGHGELFVALDVVADASEALELDVGLWNEPTKTEWTLASPEGRPVLHEELVEFGDVGASFALEPDPEQDRMFGSDSVHLEVPQGLGCLVEVHGNIIHVLRFVKSSAEEVVDAGLESFLDLLADGQCFSRAAEVAELRLRVCWLVLQLLL